MFDVYVGIVWPTPLHLSDLHCHDVLLTASCFSTILRSCRFDLSSRLVVVFVDEMARIGVFMCSIDDMSDGMF